MPRHASYFPSTHAEQVIWLNNWITTLPGLGAALSLTAGEISNTIADATWAKYCLERVGPTAKAWLQSLNAAIKTNLFEETGGSPVPFSAFALPTPIASQVANGALKRIFKLIATIKTRAACTESVREALRIVGDEETENPDAVPKLGKIVVRGGEVIIPFVKDGHMGVYIESSIDDGPWTFVTIDTSSPYNDARPLAPGKTADTRRYRLCFWDGAPTNVWVTTEEIAYAG